MRPLEVPVRVLATSCKAIRNRYLETTWGRAYEVQATFSLPPLGFEVFSFSETTEPLELATNERPEPVPESLVNAIGFELDADIGDGYSHGPLPELPVERVRLVSAEADGRTTDVFHLAYEIRGRATIQRDDLAGKPLADCLGPQVTMPISVRARDAGVALTQLARGRSSGNCGSPTPTCVPTAVSAWWSIRSGSWGRRCWGRVAT